jgi:RNA polymerase sigma-B factor
MGAPVRSVRPTRTSDLEDCDDARLLRMVHSLPRDSSLRERANEVLVTRYDWLVRSCAQPYRFSPESQEELMQVGYVGLLKAINRFDPAFGTTLTTYAQPCISGEIKRHFRDKRWQLHVRRSIQELRLELRGAVSELAQRLGRMPTGSELAEHVGASEEDIAEARMAEGAFRASSLDSPIGGDDGQSTVADLVGADDAAIDHVLDMQAVWTHWAGLPDRLQQILLMRFYGNMTQADIGQRIGLSQMHVSRLLAEALGYLRQHVAPTKREAPDQP